MESGIAASSVSMGPSQQIVEVSGAESPSGVKGNSRVHRVRHELSRARLRAIESSLENGHTWVPPSPSHRKTWEEEVISYSHMVLISKSRTLFILSDIFIKCSYMHLCFLVRRLILNVYCMTISFSGG